MTQTDAVRALDAAAMAKLSRSFVPGTAFTMTNIATCTPVTGDPIIGATVLVDRGVQSQGFDSEVVSTQTKITVYLDQVDIDLLVHGFTFTLDTGESFKLDRVDASDESIAVCIVVPA